MTRSATPDVLGDHVRAQTPDDASLRAMFGPPADGERIVQIALHALDDNPFQRRTAGMADDDPGLLELSADIKTNGIHQPLVVRPHPDDDAQHGRYQIAAGHRRRLAAHLAGLATVPCVIRPLTDDQMLDVVFSENYHRTDVNAIDRAQLIQLLVDQGMTQQAIADRLSMSRPAVSNALRLLKLPADIQQAVVAGEISNRQAEAILPLATLPAEAQRKLNGYSNLPSMIQRAKNGDSSDAIRNHVKAAVTAATNELPDHWRNYNFGDLAGVQQPICTGCPLIIDHADSKRCTLPPCWDVKSSAWQAIENRHIVELTGVEIMPERYDNDVSFLYSGDREILGLTTRPDAPPAHQCPNLRVRKGYRPGDWEWICYHPGKKECTCVAQATRAAAKDGKTAWKQIRQQTTDALAGRLAHYPLDALRLLARQYGKWEQRNAVIDWDAAQCIPVIITGLIKVYQPYDAEKSADTSRAEMAKLLALAGLRAPWLPPLEDELHNAMAHIRRELDDFIDPGDGLPTQERMAAILDQLRSILDSAQNHLAGDEQAGVLKRFHGLWPDALALNERVQASHATD